MRKFINFFVGLFCVVVGATHILLARRFGEQSRRIRLWARRIMNGMKIPWEVEQAENLPKEQPVVITSNHASMIDIPLLYAAIEIPYRMVAKAELLKVPFIGWVIRRCGFIPIQRRRHEEAIASLRRVHAFVEEGISFYLAAEGTRSRDGKLLPFKKGPFVLAIQLGVPVLPVTLINTHEVIPKKSLLPRSGIPVRVVIHEPISTKGLTYEERGELRDRVRRIIEERLERETRAD